MIRAYLILAAVAAFLFSHVGAFMYGRHYQAAIDNVAELKTQIAARDWAITVSQELSDVADNIANTAQKAERENDLTDVQLETLAHGGAPDGQCASADFMRTLRKLK